MQDADHPLSSSLPTTVRLTSRLEQASALDPLTRGWQRASDALLADQGRADLLRGSWLGHAVHPVMTFLPLGSWVSATVLDVIGGKGSRPAAQRLVATGIVTAVPTAVTGLAEYGSTQHQRDKRTTVVHALSNTTALVLMVASYRARRQGRHAKGVVLGLAAHAGTGLGGYLGGHLTEARKVSSRHPAYDEHPVVAETSG
jgi:uncharacterized membrane protein